MQTFGESAIPGGARTVLVIDDIEMNRELLCDILGDEYEVVQAANGVEGLEALTRLRGDVSLVLLDIVMPVMDGFGFLRAFRADARYDGIPVIVATSSDGPGDEERCLELGANDFVRKPYEAEVLLNRVSNFIALGEARATMAQLRRDALTGLDSREYFARHADGLLAAHGSAFDMVCCDIRDFKMLNERYGRAQCDRLLRELAGRLVELPGVVAAGRIGGDAFGVLAQRAGQDWDGLLSGIARFDWMPHLFVRFGIVEDVGYGDPADLLCDHALVAAEQLRDSSGAGVARYDEAIRERQRAERAIADGLERAFAERQFVAYYQPKHDATGRVAGAEALVRWAHPEMGLVPPAAFIPVLERNGMVSDLDSYVCSEACREVARLAELGFAPVPVSVNVSPLDFDYPGLSRSILEIADDSGIDHELLHLELTETACAGDPSSVVRSLEDLRAHGFKVDLDDFGSGFSSLSQLNTLPLDVMKVDASLVRNAVETDDFRIVRMALQLARTLGLETVAEGVETFDVAERLCALGCDLVQGYCYSRPLPAGDFEDYLRFHAPTVK